MVSFFVAAFLKSARPFRERRILGERPTRLAARAVRWGAVALLLGTLLVGLARVSSGLTTVGLSLVPLLFWVGLVIGGVILCSLLDGAWRTFDPWATLESWSRAGQRAREPWVPPWGLGPLLLFMLFWFELVSGAGFSEMWVVVAIVLYTGFSLSLRSRVGPSWALVDPLSILFGFASRAAPLRLGRDGLFYRGPLAGLVQERPMPKSLHVALFVLLGATTLDNARETVAWGGMTSRLGLEDTPAWLVESGAMVVFVLLFLAPFLAAVAGANRWVSSEASLSDLARHFSWSVIPIGIAYVLAHNVALLLIGGPQLLRQLSDPFALGWNLFGTRDLLQSFVPSPTLVWLPEIVLIVGGHVLAVFAAHRTALALSATGRAAARSQIPLTVLMSVYTIVTLGLLAQPLV